eukprot:m.12286 g.12286  ORF g.12286 m.12286 type:complete len:341 (-) comp3979_c0_seq1:453-1475(-)
MVMMDQVLRRYNLRSSLAVVRRTFLNLRKPPKQRFEPHHDYNIIKSLGKVSPGVKAVPEHIQHPPYINNDSYASPAMVTSSNFDASLLFSSDEKYHGQRQDLTKMRAACVLARKVLNYSGTLVKPGVTTEEIDVDVHNFILANNAYPSPLLYMGFPKSVCTSVNNVIVHGIPNDRKLMDGDIIKIDISTYLDGYHGDNCATFLVGEVDDDAKRLVETTKAALDAAIDICAHGVPFNEIGRTINAIADENGFTVSEAWIGHGVGMHFHCPPCIMHNRNNFASKMQAGQVFTIEPCITEGSGEHTILEDGWTAITKDDSRAAQFEQTILITENGAEILTVDP